MNLGTPGAVRTGKSQVSLKQPIKLSSQKKLVAQHACPLGPNVGPVDAKALLYQAVSNFQTSFGPEEGRK